MKQKLFMIPLVCAFLAIAGAQALAHDYDSDDSDYPLRYAAYVVHPVGIAVEYAVLRPIHWVVSRPHLRVIFGHDPRPKDKYFEWKAGVNDKEWEKCGSKPPRCAKPFPVCDQVPPVCPKMKMRGEGKTLSPALEKAPPACPKMRAAKKGKTCHAPAEALPACPRCGEKNPGK